MDRILTFLPASEWTVEMTRSALADCDCFSSDSAEYAEEILSEFRNLEDCDAAVAIDCGTLVIRIKEGEDYFFVYPIPLVENVDIRQVLINVSRYSRREMIPLRFTDMPREELAVLCDLFPYVNVRAYDDDEDMFFVRVCNECDKLQQLTDFSMGDITLSPLSSTDEEAYFSLCTDEEVNRFWGYDYREDKPDADSAYFMSVAEGEFLAGVAITLAVRYRGDFIGEAVLYDFDYLSSCEMGVRLLPAFFGRGLGSLAVETLISYAGEIGVKILRATVSEENLPSVALMNKFMIKTEEGGGKIKYRLEL